jgi:hypothetical protein
MSVTAQLEEAGFLLLVAAALACSSPEGEADRRITTETPAIEALPSDTAGMPNPASNGAHTTGGEQTPHARHGPGRSAQHAHGQASRHGEQGSPSREHVQHDTTAHAPGHMQHDTAAHAPSHEMPQEHGAHAGMEATMIMGRIGSFDLMTMAQVFPTFTFATPSADGTALDRTGFYLTQPVVTANLSSPRSVVVLRTTLNFEGITQERG